MIRDGGLPCNADAAVNSNNSRVRANDYVLKAYPRFCTGYSQGSYTLWAKAADLPKRKEWINKPGPCGRSGSSPPPLYVCRTVSPRRLFHPPLVRTARREMRSEPADRVGEGVLPVPEQGATAAGRAGGPPPPHVSRAGRAAWATPGPPPLPLCRSVSPRRLLHPGWSPGCCEPGPDNSPGVAEPGGGWISGPSS
jgi:hypothetical protein